MRGIVVLAVLGTVLLFIWYIPRQQEFVTHEKWVAESEKMLVWCEVDLDSLKVPGSLAEEQSMASLSAEFDSAFAAYDGLAVEARKALRWRDLKWLRYSEGALQLKFLPYCRALRVVL